MLLLPDRLKEIFSRKKSKEELNKHYEEVELEKGDFLAMVIAGIITFLPVLLVASALFYGLAWLFFIR